MRHRRLRRQILLSPNTPRELRVRKTVPAPAGFKDRVSNNAGFPETPRHLVIPDFVFEVTWGVSECEQQRGEGTSKVTDLKTRCGSVCLLLHWGPGFGSHHRAHTCTRPSWPLLGSLGTPRNPPWCTHTSYPVSALAAPVSVRLSTGRTILIIISNMSWADTHVKDSKKKWQKIWNWK